MHSKGPGLSLCLAMPDERNGRVCKLIPKAELKIKSSGYNYGVLLMLVLGLGAFFLRYLGGIRYHHIRYWTYSALGWSEQNELESHGCSKVSSAYLTHTLVVRTEI